MAIETPVVTPPVTPPPVVTPPVVPPVTPPVVPPVVPPVTPPVTPPVVEPPKTPPVKTSILGTPPVEPPKKDGEVKPVVPQGAPEKGYADFKLPEGITLDPKAIEAFKAVATKQGLSQETAQELVSFQAQSVKAEIDGRLAAVAQQSEAWAKESRALFGAAAELHFSHAAKAIESFGTPKMREILTAVGLDNHPEFVAMFARVGAKLAEGQPVEGKTAGNERVPTEKLMFDKMGPKA